jgi:alpha-tubulin suppressor-like RCC1 family protein
VTGEHCSLFLDAAGQLLACGTSAAVGHGDADTIHSDTTPLAALAGVRVRSVAAGSSHSLAIGWDGRIYSWGDNGKGQLGQGDKVTRPAPALVQGLERVCGIATLAARSLAVTQSGDVFSWGEHGARDMLRPIIVEGFGGVRVRRVCAGDSAAFAIGVAGELFSSGSGYYWLLGHGDEHDQPSPKRVEVLQGIQVSSHAVGFQHALALAEDGRVYAWGQKAVRTVLCDVHVEKELLPKPVEALRGVRVASVAASRLRRCAVADTGELWAWGMESLYDAALGHGECRQCPLPTPIESLRGVKVDAVAAGVGHTLAVADGGSVYAWCDEHAAKWGALGLGPSVSDAGRMVPTPQRIPALRVTCRL